MSGLASFPMYDRKELVVPHCELWNLIRKGLLSMGLESPTNLIFGDEGITVWNSKNLILSQTCGMPFRTFLRGKVNYIGSPVYNIDDCPDGYYRSIFVVSRNSSSLKLKDFIDKKFAVNGFDSQSGYAAPYNHCVRIGSWFRNLILSGSHWNSAFMVSVGAADIACIDEVSWKIMKRYDKFSSSLIGIEKTAPTPSLPFITVRYSEHVSQFFEVLGVAIKDLSLKSSKMLLLKGLKKIPLEEYYEVQNPRF